MVSIRECRKEIIRWTRTQGTFDWIFLYLLCFCCYATEQHEYSMYVETCTCTMYTCIERTSCTCIIQYSTCRAYSYSICIVLYQYLVLYWVQLQYQLQYRYIMRRCTIMNWVDPTIYPVDYLYLYKYWYDSTNYDRPASHISISFKNDIYYCMIGPHGPWQKRIATDIEGCTGTTLLLGNLNKFHCSSKNLKGIIFASLTQSIMQLWLTKISLSRSSQMLGPSFSNEKHLSWSYCDCAWDQTFAYPTLVIWSGSPRF